MSQGAMVTHGRTYRFHHVTLTKEYLNHMALKHVVLHMVSFEPQKSSHAVGSQVIKQSI